MINDEAESLFAYNRPGDTFDTFRDLTFTPAFEPVFDDPELEMRAEEICGDDEFCKFDIAATKDEDIGMSTMLGVRDFDNIVELAQPSKELMATYIGIDLQLCYTNVLG